VIGWSIFTLTENKRGPGVFRRIALRLSALRRDTVANLSQATWLVSGLHRDPEKKLVPDPDAVLGLVYRWRDEAAGPDTRSRGSAWRMKPAGTGSGCHAASGRTAPSGV